MKQQEGKRRKKPNFKIPFILQIALNTALILLAIVLCISLAKEVYFFIHASLYTGILMDDKILDRTLVFFLYFEFLSMIIKYFQENYHFPLRYFLYIGITAMIRLIIVHHVDALNTFMFAGAILVLVISYSILSYISLKKDRH
ncbi:phosphate-starvation-inducible protein PsiE [Heyndrickxia acidicola]|uniref:Protein PsiE n=1 Tax=Heyndrickxia acidicola TaxID=209389 RepID=A0ABU6MMC2_9BACI|nr:phosphate-starvation-inducible protein PsiE [Heyndrickxia acidicola]MED1205831.1 phosphate-starvation-inducible protein PsiE [Heyndrickxia acidicola]